jgi:hypothetical protein
MASVRHEVAALHPFIPFQKPQVFLPDGQRRWITFAHQIRFDFTTRKTIPPTSARAPAAGGMNRMSASAMCNPRKSIGFPGAKTLKHKLAKTMLPTATSATMKVNLILNFKFFRWLVGFQAEPTEYPGRPGDCHGV